MTAVWNTGLPQLPTSDPFLDEIIYDSSVKEYISDNIFAILFFMTSFIVGGFMLFFSVYSKRKKGVMNEIADSIGVLSVFVLLAGIWILTDSRAFLLFKDSVEHTECENAVTMISFVSFLLLPIVYAEFLGCYIKTEKFIKIVETMMIVNLVVFMTMVLTGMPSVSYLVLLFLQHGFIVVLIAVSIKVYFKDLFSLQNVREHNLAMGTTAFGVISVIAIITFMMGGYRIYPVIYGIGLLVLVFFMLKMLFAEVTDVYKKQMQAAIYKEMAYMDGLTGLQNRNAFIWDTNVVMDTANLGIIIMDINDLKEINDTYGHECGDMIIREAADVIKNAFDSMGHCYRIGGDEFVVICDNAGEVSLKAAIAKSEDMQAAFNRKNRIQLNLATGYAVNEKTKDPQSFNGLMSEADRSMYIDKSNKKNRQ